MSSELQKYSKSVFEKKQNLFNAEVINFPNDNNLEKSKNLSSNAYNHWKISDETNEDQYKALIGICFMFGALVLTGLYSNLF